MKSGNRAMVLTVIGLLLAIFCISGGCGGGSSSSVAKTKIAIVGELKQTDSATLSANGIELLSGDKEQIFATRNVCIATSLENVTSEKKSEIKEMFDSDGHAIVSIYEPTSSEITTLKTMLGVEETSILQEYNLIEDEKTRSIVTFTVYRDVNGNIYNYAETNYNKYAKHQLVRDDSIRKEDVDAGMVWVRFNRTNSGDAPYDVIRYVLGDKIEDSDESYYISEEKVIGKVNETAVIVDRNEKTITILLDGTSYDCLSYQTENGSYSIGRPGIELPDDAQRVLEEPEGLDEGSADEEDGDLKARETNMKSFADWMREDKTQGFVLSANARQNTFLEKAAVLVKDVFTGTACADSPKPAELFDVAWRTIGVVGSTFSNLPGLNLTATTTIASTHHFDEDGREAKDGGNDYYYVQQHCVINNGMAHKHWYKAGKYKKVKLHKAFGKDEWYWIGGAECDEFYLSKYGIKAELVSGDQAGVTCVNAAPEAYNKETNITVTHGWSIGTSVHGGGSKSDKKEGRGGFAFTFGYESKKQESYKTLDVEQMLYNANHVIRWEHTVTKTPHRDSRWTRLTYPADLAVSTYQPRQCYILKIPTDKRSKYTKLKNTISTQVSGAYSRNSGSRRERHVDYTVSASGDIILPKPPLFCLDKHTINFDEKTAKTAYVTIYSQGTWKYDESTVPSWLEITRTDENCQLTIVAEPNNTGATRTAKIKLQREDGKEKWDKRTITVTQSKYSK